MHIKAWEIDMSRRQLEFTEVKDVDQSSKLQNTEPSVFESLFEPSGAIQDIVILNTEKGFVPETITLRKNQVYRFHVVNVDEKNKNVSFKFDAFSENHNTVFGKPKVFQVQPKQDGIFSFHCPETELKGKVVIINSERGLATSSK
ncbi:MAG: cupredoxin domain-containing protein [Bdellovibrionaceae bacterium]|nr:cupredoxin domain-containing protein [Pseudobdellovibrionaceae bacterium]